MICTFGDTTDVVWWRELSLPTRTIVGRDGRLLPVELGDRRMGVGRPRPGRHGRYDELAGRTVKQAQARIVELLAESGGLIGEPRPITHPVKFYERGDRPLEIVSSRQWFVETLPLRDRLLARGDELRWHPPYMAHRYRAWVEGLNGDWNISRQRFFGVPFPVWYPVDDVGRGRLRRAPSSPTRTGSPSTPRPTCPTGTPRTSAGGPGGSSATPT